MTTWTNDTKTSEISELLQEDGFSLLQENGDLILLDGAATQTWTYDQKS